jgi:hypothetical protein
VHPLLARSVLAFGLMATGYLVGRAQPSAPTFELVVEAPGGQTTVRCVKGCTLAWVERGLNPRSKSLPQFEFSCSGSARCSSARIGGWVEP